MAAAGQGWRLLPGLRWPLQTKDRPVAGSMQWWKDVTLAEAAQAWLPVTPARCAARAVKSAVAGNQIAQMEPCPQKNSII